MTFNGICTVLPALMLTGCVMLPGQDSDYSRFCSVSGVARPGETYHVTASEDFWLTQNGRYLSQTEYTSPAGNFRKLTGLISGDDPAQARSRPIKVRVFRVDSESARKRTCLPVRYDSNDARRKMDSLHNGRRMVVYSQDAGQSGLQIYNKSRGAGFSYRLL